MLYQNTSFDIRCSWRVAERREAPRWEIFSSFQQLRSIQIVPTLGAEEWTWASKWIERLPAHLNGASSLMKLHINLVARSDAKHWKELIQGRLDRTMALLGETKYKGGITAKMDTDIGFLGLETSSYYAMLDKLGG